MRKTPKRGAPVSTPWKMGWQTRAAASTSSIGVWKPAAAVLAATFRVWQKQVSELKRLEKERYRELENWKIALTFGEERLGQRYFARWRAYPQRRLAVAAKFLFSSSLARNFAYWRHVVGHLRQCRGKAADFFTAMTFKRTWGTWKESIRFSKDTKLKLNSALSFWSLQVPFPKTARCRCGAGAGCSGAPWCRPGRRSTPWRSPAGPARRRHGACVVTFG